MEDLLPFALLCFTSFFYVDQSTRYDAGFLDHDQWYE